MIIKLILIYIAAIDTVGILFGIYGFFAPKWWGK